MTLLCRFHVCIYLWKLWKYEFWKEALLYKIEFNDQDITAVMQSLFEGH